MKLFKKGSLASNICFNKDPCNITALRITDFLKPVNYNVLLIALIYF